MTYVNVQDVQFTGSWIVKPVASSRGRGIYLIKNPNQVREAFQNKDKSEKNIKWRVSYLNHHVK